MDTKILVLAEHDNSELKPTTLNTITAAKMLGKVSVLIAGYECSNVVTAARQIKDVEIVLEANHKLFQNS